MMMSEARACYSFQMAMETTHSETYYLLIDTLMKDPDETPPAKKKENCFMQ